MKQPTMKAYGRAVLDLTSVVDFGEWSPPSFGRFTPEKEPSASFGWAGGPQSRSERFRLDKISVCL